MKKTLIALMVLASAASYGATTTIATMQDLVNAATIGTPTLSTVYETTQVGGGVYTFAQDSYLGGITNAALVSQLANTSGTGDASYLTIAAWIRPDSVSGVHSVFSYGGQSTGIKFCTNGAGLQMTTKGHKDFDSKAGGSLTVGEWTLVAFTIPGSASGNIRYYVGDNDGGYYTINGVYNSDTNILTPSEADTAFAIASGNANGVRETFSGDIANLTIIGSDSMLNNSAIAAMVLKPTETPTTPEPATATLSLLALVGLAARRKRH